MEVKVTNENFEAEVLKCFKGEIKGNIEVYALGGIVSLENWEKTLNQEQKEKMAAMVSTEADGSPREAVDYLGMKLVASHMCNYYEKADG